MADKTDFYLTEADNGAQVHFVSDDGISGQSFDVNGLVGSLQPGLS